MIYRFVISGTHEQYRDYIRDKYQDHIKYVYVRNHLLLHGVVNPHGVFIGSWIKHPHIKEILLQLNVSTHEHNPGLEQAILEYHNHVSLLN